MVILGASLATITLCFLVKRRVGGERHFLLLLPSEASGIYTIQVNMNSTKPLAEDENVISFRQARTVQRRSLDAFVQSEFGGQVVATFNATINGENVPLLMANSPRTQRGIAVLQWLDGVHLKFLVGTPADFEKALVQNGGVAPQ